MHQKSANFFYIIACNLNSGDHDLIGMGLHDKEGSMCVKKFSYLLLMLMIFPRVMLAEDIEEIKETVVKLPGVITKITLDYGLYPNIGVSVGSDGILLVDTGHKTAAPKLFKVVSSMGSPVKYIINTHSHGDHAGGNEIFSKDAVVIRYDNLLDMTGQGIVTCDTIPISGKSGLGFEACYSLFFNDEKIKIIPVPGVHSNEDLIIYFSGSGVVHMGDLLLTESFPAVGSKVKEYLHILDKVLNIFPSNTIFIGGHGRDFTIEDIKQYRIMVDTTIEIVTSNMRAGKGLEEMQADNILNGFEKWGLFLEFLNTDKWIECIFKSYSSAYQGNII